MKYNFFKYQNVSKICSMDEAFFYTANICHLKCVDTEMKWDGKLANQSGMLNAFT